MGDVLHALPAVAALRAARPEWTIDWVVDERWTPLLVDEVGAGPVVDRVYAVPVQAWKRRPLSVATLRSLLGFRRLRGRYDVVVDMQGTLRSAAIGWLAGGGALVGHADPREPPAAWLYGRKIPRTGAHVVAQGVALLGAAVGVELTPAPAQLPRILTAEHWAEATLPRRPLCVLTPGAGWGAKQWPAERYGALATELRSMGFAVLVSAARADDPAAAAVVAASSTAASAAAAQLRVCDLAQLVALLRRADLAVGGDTGPMHLAAALAVPVVALFGPTDPARNGPWGPGARRVLRSAASPTSYKHSATPDAGLAQLTVETVLAAVREIAAGV